ncbi:MAG: hypothetical protein C4550_04370 [Nitrospiraceae bacterium]|nr:MAG: hypothetical protein C4550_04370 [Nitrospiraceae bacterium]
MGNNQSIIERLVSWDESISFEAKRVSGKMVRKALETIVAFANTKGGILVLGMEDYSKAKGTDRLIGIQENAEAVDELQQKIQHKIIPPIPIDDVLWKKLNCILHDGNSGEIVIISVPMSPKVHSIVEDGTWKRLEKGNREMTAAEINELCFSRGVISAESELVDVPFELLNTDSWRSYCENRGINSGDIKDRMFRIGLARKKDNLILPTKAAVLCFAEDPSGILSSKDSVRVFHYAGTRIEHGAVPNLLKKPKTISGPLIKQITNAYEYVINEIAKGLTIATSGFETVHRYPTRVIREAITNAVIHRDYHITRDVHIRIFDNRIEVESPGLFPGNITTETIAYAGSFSRNPLIVNCLREFPEPPNIDAGEGVRMMFAAMQAQGLYPPFYSSRRDSVVIFLLNEERPPVWEQVSEWINRNGFITNGQLCRIATVDTLKASKMLRKWVELEMLEVDMSKGKKNARYRKAGSEADGNVIGLLSGLSDNKKSPLL